MTDDEKINWTLGAGWFIVILAGFLIYVFQIAGKGN